MNPKKPMKNSERNSIREASNILKGITILTVLVNHYLNHYTDFGIGGFANVLVSIFFLLSGYGIFISLTKRWGKDLDHKQIINFYYGRLCKILPLFWLALLIQGIIVSSSYPVFSFLGFEPKGHYWFIASILECYLVAPFLAFFVNVNVFRTFLITTVLFGTSIVLSSYSSTFSFIFEFLRLSKEPYLGIYFLNIYLFFIGMCIHKFDLVDKQRTFASKVSSKLRYSLFFILVFVTLTYIFMEKIVPRLPLFGGLLLLLVLCVYAMGSFISANMLPLKLINFIGINSFSIYLFHMSYYFLLTKMGYLEKGSPLGGLVVVGLFPIFLLISLSLEKAVNFSVARINALSPRGIK